MRISILISTFCFHIEKIAEKTSVIEKKDGNRNKMIQKSQLIQAEISYCSKETKKFTKKFGQMRKKNEANDRII